MLAQVRIGYVRTETNAIEQVQEAIAEVSFYSSGAFGTVRQVLLSYRREKPAV